MRDRGLDCVSVIFESCVSLFEMGLKIVFWKVDLKFIGILCFSLCGNVIVGGFCDMGLFGDE